MKTTITRLLLVVLLCVVLAAFAGCDNKQATASDAATTPADAIQQEAPQGQGAEEKDTALYWNFSIPL